MKKKILVFIFFTLIILGAKNIYANSDIVVILDPGHGGDDSGAVYDGIYEKDVNWKIATKVKEIFDKTPGITGILSRQENTNPSLKERGLLAKNKNADLLVSFHINSSGNVNSARGAEVYITGDTNSPRYYQSSNKLANSVLANLRSIGVPSRSSLPIIKVSRDGEVYSDGFITDYYGIIRNPMYYGIPGVLIEHCYINSIDDQNEILKSDSRIYEMAQQDANAIIANKELFRRQYIGNINTDVKTMTLGKNAAGVDYISGEILIAEWIDNVAYKPTQTPKMTLKSVDGTFSTGMYIRNEGGLKYYYDRVISNLDITKQYYIEVELTDTKNVGKNKSQKANINTQKIIGEFKDSTMKIEENKIVFRQEPYVGEINTDVKTMTIGKNGAGREYMYGELLIAEWINGNANIPKGTPKMTLKSTDGTYSAGMYVKHLEGLRYYYDRVVYNLDPDKDYYIEVELINVNNTSAKKIQKANINISNKQIGKLKDYIVEKEGNNLVFKYIGEINTDVKTMTIGKNGAGREYMYGELLIAEWINGVAYEPKDLPEMTLKSTDGTYSAGMYVKHIDGLRYYYDRVIYNLDPNKEYYIEVKLTSAKNISNKKVQKANMNLGKVGEFKNTNVIISNNKMIFENIEQPQLQSNMLRSVPNIEEEPKIIQKKSVIIEKENNEQIDEKEELLENVEEVDKIKEEQEEKTETEIKQEDKEQEQKEVENDAQEKTQDDDLKQDNTLNENIIKNDK